MLLLHGWKIRRPPSVPFLFILQEYRSQSGLARNAPVSDSIAFLQGGTSCGKLASGWRGPTEFVRTKWLARLSSVGLTLRPSSVLSPQSSVLSPHQTKKSENTAFLLQKCQKKRKSFCSKKLDLRHFSRACRENLTIRTLRTKFRIKSACEGCPAFLLFVIRWRQWYIPTFNALLWIDSEGQRKLVF